MILKCTQCGNTFNKETPNSDDVVSCPVCDAQYIAVVKAGKVQLKDYMFEEKDLGQL